MQITHSEPIWTERHRALCRKEASWGIVERLFLELHISMIKSKYYLWLKTFYSIGRKN